MSTTTPLILRFNGISESHAERLLALAWRVVEEHTLASPKVEAQSAKNSIDIKLTFHSAEDRAVVEENLSLSLRTLVDHQGKDAISIDDRSLSSRPVLRAFCSVAFAASLPPMECRPLLAGAALAP